eukprot:scaffold26280_cov58-Phaeocystis_antarctica.AAC.1
MAKQHAQFWNLPELSSGELGATPLTHSLTHLLTVPVGVPNLLTNLLTNPLTNYSLTLLTNPLTNQARSASSRTTHRGFSRFGATISLATGRASKPSGARVRAAMPWDLGCPSRPSLMALTLTLTLTTHHSPLITHHSPLTRHPHPHHSPSPSPSPPPSPLTTHPSPSPQS